MLTKCGPFSHALEAASEAQRAQLEVYALVTDSTGEVVTINLVSTDSQKVTTADGKVTEIHGRNIAEIIKVYFELFPGRRPLLALVRVVTPTGIKEQELNLALLNPELIATVAKRLLRECHA